MKIVNSSQVSTRPVTHSRQTRTVVGNAVTSKLCAAGPRQPVEKAVFSISNLTSQCSVADIRSYCKELNVRVLFCFDISNSNYNSKAFKLAVSATDSNKIFDGNYWPRGVIIRPWGTSSRIPTIVISATGSDVQDEVLSSVSSLSSEIETVSRYSEVSAGDNINESSLLNSTVIETHTTNSVNNISPAGMESDDAFCMNDETIITQISRDKDTMTSNINITTQKNGSAQ